MIEAKNICVHVGMGNLALWLFALIPFYQHCIMIVCKNKIFLTVGMHMNAFNSRTLAYDWYSAPHWFLLRKPKAQKAQTAASNHLGYLSLCSINIQYKGEASDSKIFVVNLLNMISGSA